MNLLSHYALAQARVCRFWDLHKYRAYYRVFSDNNRF